MDEQGDATGVILDKASAFTVDEMVGGFDDFSSNVLYLGGDDGGRSGEAVS